MAEMTLTEYNERNRQFWDDQRIHLKERMANDAIREAALAALRSEVVRAIPVRCQMSIYQALEIAEGIGKQFLAQQSCKGGKAKKTDALQLLIVRIVERRPAITTDELKEELYAHQGIDVISDIDVGVISFTNHNGNLKDAKLSGLKHRLSRAKANFRSL
jgi:hypothetical protein